MVRPKRKRSELEPALEGAKALLQRLLSGFSQEQRLLKLVELLEEGLQVFSGNKTTASSVEQKELAGYARSYAANQLLRLHELGYSFAREASLAGFFFGQLFESVRHEPEATRGFGKRKNSAYFSPAPLAYYMAHSLFGGKVLDFDGLTVLDPCAGAGALLIAALDYLASSARLAGKNISDLNLIERHIFAVELDPLTMRVCRLCLAAAGHAKISELTPANFKNLDGLTAAINSSQYIIANPPWGKNSAYKKFVERIDQLLIPGGLAAVLTPASIYSERGALALRKQLLEQLQWISLEGFINEDLAFAVHPFYKYALIVFAKESNNLKPEIKVRFGLKGGAPLVAGQIDWLPYSHNFVQSSGANSLAILEIENRQEMEFHRASLDRHGRLYELHSDRQPQMERGLHTKKPVAKSDSIWSCRFQRDFDMSLDKNNFVRAKSALALGFCPDQNGRLRREQEILLPLIEGKMICQYEGVKGGKSGPQYFVREADFIAEGARIGFVSVSSASNSRSMIAALLPDYPAGNSAPTLVVSGERARSWALILTAVLNSFCFDYFLRTRLSGNNLNYFLLDHCLVPKTLVASRFQNLPVREAKLLDSIARLAGELSLRENLPLPPDHLQQQRALLEALVARLYCFQADEFAYVLHGCLNPIDSPSARGFQRVDKNLPFKERLPYLAYASFSSLTD